MKYLLPCLALLITACSPSVETKGADKSPTSEISGAVDLRMTSEIQTSVRAVDLTIIPNDVATWVSQIILTDSSGALHSVSANGGETKALGLSAVDTLGLMRKGAPGILLSIVKDGSLFAAIESDDEGTLKPIPLSGPTLSLSGFCSYIAAPSDTFHVISGDKILALNIDVDGKNLIRVSKSSELEKCPAAKGLLSHNRSAPFLPLRDADSRAISITPGITTDGVSTVAAAVETMDNLGGPFNKGAVIVADAKAPRLVLISRSFAQEILTGKTLTSP